MLFYQIGASIVEVLNLNDHCDLSALDKAVRKLGPELLMLLSGPDATSAALAHAALGEFWGVLRLYPVYRHLEPQSETLPNSVRKSPALFGTRFRGLTGAQRQRLRRTNQRLLSDAQSGITGNGGGDG